MPSAAAFFDSHVIDGPDGLNDIHYTFIAFHHWPMNMLD